MLDGAVRAPQHRDAPAWLEAALRRGLRVNPSERWPSMTALLGELDRRLAGRRGRTIAAMAAAALIVGAAFVVVSWPRPRAADPCPDASGRLAGAWDELRRAGVRAAFEKTGASYASRTADLVTARLDADAHAWVESQSQACRATRIEGRQSDSMLDRRMDCLDRWRSATAALTALWAGNADAAAVENAMSAIDSLPAISRCADVAALGERVPRPRDRASLESYDQARSALDRAAALRGARRPTEAKAAAEAARDAAERPGLESIRAGALLLVGDAAHMLDDTAAARPALRESARLAAIVHDDALAVEAMTLLIDVVGVGETQLPEALGLADATGVMLERAGNPPRLRATLAMARARVLQTAARYTEARKALGEADHLLAAGSVDLLRVTLLTQQGSLSQAEGDYAGARAITERAISIAERVLGADHPRLAIMYNNLGMLFGQLADYPAAAGALDKALRIKAAVIGEDNPGYANGLNNLANVRSLQGRYDEAEKLFARALAIRAKALGPDSPAVAMSLGNLAALYGLRGRHREAVTANERALAIKVKAYTHDHPSVADTLESVSTDYDELGDFARARSTLEEAIAIRRKVQGEHHPDTLTAIGTLAFVLERNQRCGEAMALAGATLDGLQQALGPDHSSLSVPLEALGECDLAAGRPRAAVPRLERAIALHEKAGEPDRLPHLRFSLAQALWDSGGDRARCRSLVKQAENQLVVADPGNDLAAVRAWLAAHPW